MLGLAVYTGEAESRDLFLLLVQTSPLVPLIRLLPDFPEQQWKEGVSGIEKKSFLLL